MYVVHNILEDIEFMVFLEMLHVDPDGTKLPVNKT
jgi:hypothetical protein